MHLKRSKIPKMWPIPRKGTKFVVVASHAKTKAIPILIILRDILKIANTRREAKYIISNKDVKVNNKIVKVDNFPVQIFDVVTLDKIKKNYRLEIVNKKFGLVEISEKEAERKIVKIIGKKILKKGKIQMNLEDGQNFITEEKFRVGDSAVVNTKENKIEKILELKPGAKVEIMEGKHVGEKGIVEKIDDQQSNFCDVKLKDKKVSIPKKIIWVIG